jgi:hypothetical protein
MRTKYKNQIEYVKSKGAINGAKKVLVIGASTGFDFKNFKCFWIRCGYYWCFLKNRQQQEEQLPQVYNLLL